MLRPKYIISLFVIVILFKTFYTVLKRNIDVPKKEIIRLLFASYFVILFYIVTFKDKNYGTNNFILFKEIFRYKIGSKLFVRNVIGNILLFVPFGMFIGYYVKETKLYIIILSSILLSFLIETIQSIIGRTFDVDDILLNLIGGIIGFVIYRLQRKYSNIFQRQIIKDILCLLSILIIIYLSFIFDFWRLLWIT